MESATLLLYREINKYASKSMSTSVNPWAQIAGMDMSK